MSEIIHPVARRSFLSSAAVAAVAAGAATPALAAQANARFQPQRHTEDDWLDAPTGGHRFVIDSTTVGGGAAALLYANNFFTANKSGYNLDPPALAVVIVLRHFSTPIGYTDAIWAKYGGAFAELANFTDPKTKQAPTKNPFNSPDYGLALPNFGTTLGSLIQKNVQFAICDMATHFLAGAIAEKTKGDANAIYRELTAGLIPNSHLVPAGIVAVNRAQERGYSFAYSA